MSSNKQIILITGANTGLGLEAVKALLRSGTPYEIIIGSRKVENGETAIESLKRDFPSHSCGLSVVQVDLESDESIETARDTVASRFGRLDCLINNGGANIDVDIQAGKIGYRDGWNKSWNVNVAGTMVMTSEFVPLLLKSSDPRLIFMTSGTSALAETERYDTQVFQNINKVSEAGWPKPKVPNPVMVYRSTKTGLNMAMREWVRILKNDGVKIWAISPGFLATGLAGIGAEKLKQMGALDPSVGGEFIKDVVQGRRDADVGKIIRSDMIQPF